jgi:hypothetical protein
MSTSLMMCLQALGYDCDEDEVNNVMGARPMKGAAWEHALAAAQHYGCRATLVVPATLRQLKGWTDAGVPVMIAWNPEGRDWSHASTAYHVAEGPIDTVDDTQIVMGDGPGLYVWVADPNIPNPDKTTRIVHEDLFYSKWFEKWPNYLVRRPAMAVDREVTPDGRQVVASTDALSRRVADRYLEGKGGRGKGKKPQEVRQKKDPNAPVKGKVPKSRDPASRDLAEGAVSIRRGPHQSKGQRGTGQKGKGKRQRHQKHKGQPMYAAMAARVADRFMNTTGESDV